MPRPDITAYIDANSKDYERAMARVRRETGQTADHGRRSFAAMSAQLRGVAAGAARIAAPAAAVGTVLAGIAVAGKRAAEEISDLGAQAKTAGVNFEDFQELKYAAEQNLVGVDALTDGLKELQLRADEFILTGKGSAAESFARLGYTAEELATKLKEPDKLFEEIIARLKTLDKAAQIRISDELFGGTAGEQFVRLLDQGTRSIGELREEGRKFGVVMDEEFLKRAEDVNRAWNTMATIVGTSVKKAVIEVVNATITLLDNLRKVENRQTSTLQTSLQQIYAERQQLKEEMAQLEAENEGVVNDILGPILDRQLEQDRKEYEARDAALVDRAMKIREVLDRRNGYGGEFEATPGVQFTPTATDGNRGGGRDKNTKALREEKMAYAEVIMKLREEIDTMGLSELQREIILRQREAQVGAASEEGQEIARLVTELESEKLAQEQAAEAAEEHREALTEIGDKALDWIDRAIDGTLDWRDVLREVTDELWEFAKTGGGFFGILGNLFGGIGGFGGFPLAPGGGAASGVMVSGLFASGGIANKPSIFAEAGPEAAVPLPDGRRIPVDLRGQGAGNVTSSNTYNITINGDGMSARDVGQEVVRQIEAYDKNMAPKTVHKTMAAMTKNKVPVR